jgi:flagellar biosynthetic protein FliQ
VILKTSGPIMLAGLGIGLIIALFQALTTIQEMTLTFVPKILVIFMAVVVFLPFMMTTIIEFTNGLFDRISNLG